MVIPVSNTNRENLILNFVNFIATNMSVADFLVTFFVALLIINCRYFILINLLFYLDYFYIHSISNFSNKQPQPTSLTILDQIYSGLVVFCLYAFIIFLGIKGKRVFIKGTFFYVLEVITSY